MPQIHRFFNISQKTSVACFKICESVAIITTNNNSKLIYSNNLLKAIALDPIVQPIFITLIFYIFAFYLT